MCTVTYLPLGNNNFILTSNRDEDLKRETIMPEVYFENGVKLIYPKDKWAGGTWIGLSDKKRLVCLLNGGFTAYEREASYRMSRGIIVKKLLTVDNTINLINDFDFEGIAPFTIVYLDWSTNLKTYELVWDGTQIYFKELEEAPKIWSSSTLYSHEMKKQREVWFKDWLKKQHEFQQSEILKFHHQANEDSETYIKMKRFYAETVSVTSIFKNNDVVNMNYEDVLKEKFSKIEL